jgi:signal transduction histidine kinase
VIYRLQGDYEKALELQREYVAQIAETDDTSGIAMAYYQLGANLLRMDQYDEASSHLQLALDYAERLNDHALSYKILNGLGILYKNLYQHKESLAAYEKAIEYCLRSGDTASLAIIYNGIGILYKEMDSTHRALPYFQDGLAIAEKTGNLAAVASQSRNIGLIHFQNDELDLAEQYHQKALEIRERQGVKLHIAGSYHDLGEVNLARGDLDQAENYFLEALEIFKEINALISENTIYKQLAKLYEQKGDYRQSNDFLTRFYAIHDSLKDNDLREKINELDIQYETARKDSELAAQRLAITKNRSQRNLFMIGSGALLLLAWFLIYRNRQGKRLASAQIENLEKQQKLLALDYMVQGQEEERKRIARDLHDGLGSLLASVRQKIKSIQGQIDSLSEMNVPAEAEKLIGKAYDEVRRISHDMMPASLVSLGLVDAVEDLVADLRSTGALRIHFDHEGSFADLPDKIKINVYRLIQEISANALKHAEANVLTIAIESTSRTLDLSLTDDGKGFDFNEATQHGGLGMKNIESRVKYLEGELVIDSKPGKGTAIHIAIPIKA